MANEHDYNLTAHLTSDEIERALRTLAEMYDNYGDPSDHLSEVQKDLATRVLRIKDTLDDQLAGDTR